MVPLSQMTTVAGYVLAQKLKGRKRYPLVLMLEPLFQCNLACPGCGKIQYPDHILKRRLTPEQCWAVAEECCTPMVAIPGGEPLIHPEIDKYDCTPWGMPTYNVFGWQKPCYLLQDGYAATFAELMEGTAWEKYGTKSGNPKCKDCMVHSGYEASAVDDTFSSLSGFRRTVKATLFPS